MHAARRRSTVVWNTVVGLVAAGGLVLSGVVAVSAAASTDPTISINNPAGTATPKAGTVVLSGNVAKGSAGTTTVLYVLDATASTHLSAGSDCNGDGSASVADDLNGDGSVDGDVLDCEIGAVKKLNSSLISSYSGTSMVVGVEAFSHNAAVAALNTTDTSLFAAPSYTGGEAQPRIITAAQSIWRGSIESYVHRDLGASPTSYDAAVATALSALHSAPAGPKWVMLLSDGKTSVADSTLSALHASGIHLSSFAVGTGSTCKSSGALAKM
jgi:hypothetical protein